MTVFLDDWLHNISDYFPDSAFEFEPVDAVFYVEDVHLILQPRNPWIVPHRMILLVQTVEISPTFGTSGLAELDFSVFLVPLDTSIIRMRPFLVDFGVSHPSQSAVLPGFVVASALRLVGDGLLGEEDEPPMIQIAIYT